MDLTSGILGSTANYSDFGAPVECADRVGHKKHKCSPQKAQKGFFISWFFFVLFVAAFYAFCG
jgi:hypothetical protein